MWDFGKFASRCKGVMCLPQALCSILKLALLKGDHVSIHGTPVSPGDKLLPCTWSHRVYTEYPVVPMPGSPSFSSAAPPLGHTPSFLPWTRAGLGGGNLLTDLLLPPASRNLLPQSSWSNLVKSEIRSTPPPIGIPWWSALHLRSRSVSSPGLQSPAVSGPSCLLKADPAHLHWPFSQLWSLQAHPHLPTFTLAVALIFFPSQLRCHLLQVFS